MVCAALLGPSLTGCGPLESQLEERASASAFAAQSHSPTVVMGTPRADPTVHKSKPQTPAAQTPSPRFTLTAVQANMSAEVQRACGPLLSRTGSPIPPEVVGECIAQAMQAGGSYTAEIETNGTSLPGGEHHAQVQTGPTFAARVTGEAGTDLYIGDGGGRLSGRNGTVDVDLKGGPDETSAAIVAQAAEHLLSPARLKLLLAEAKSVNVNYAPDTVDAESAAVRLTGFGVHAIQGVDTVSLEVVVDQLYRPVRLNIIGTAQSIPASTSVLYSGWGDELPGLAAIP